ncbi:hypothetical protein [Thiocystis violacea]|uniref:hypothetical protein n=1 Tax=Thiocystis violacea TaxID=13725 RepID=UPI00190633AD|nr:hypothetical protein [Thiocystis violacea]
MTSHNTLAMAMTLGLLSLMLPAHSLAGGLNGIPPNVSARMYRLQAQQNLTHDSSAAARTGATGTVVKTERTSTTVAIDDGARNVRGGTGNLTIGDFSHSSISGLREVNILVDGDIINWNSR